MIESEAARVAKQLKEEARVAEVIQQLEIIRKKARETELKLKTALLKDAKEKAKQEAETKALENLVEKRKEELDLINKARTVTKRKLLEQTTKAENDRLRLQLKQQEEAQAKLNKILDSAKTKRQNKQGKRG